LDTPTNTDVFPIWQAPYAITITKIVGTVKGGTSVAFNLDERTASGLNSSGTSVMSGNLTASTTGANTTTFTNAGIASDAFICYIGSTVTGSVNQITIRIDFTKV
jgi:hypothetical protein